MIRIDCSSISDCSTSGILRVLNYATYVFVSASFYEKKPVKNFFKPQHPCEINKLTTAT